MANPQGVPIPNPRSTSIHTVGTRKLNHGRIYLINGINASLEQATSHATMLSNFGGGVEVTVIHYETRGLIADLFHCVGCSLNIPSATTQALVNEVQTFHRTQPPEGKIMINSHSGGAIQSNNAIAKISPEERNRIVYRGYAPGALVSKESCFSVENYAFKNDPVVKFAILKNRSEDQNITYMRSDYGSPSYSHAFTTPEFMYHQRDNMDQFIKACGGFLEN